MARVGLVATGCQRMTVFKYIMAVIVGALVAYVAISLLHMIFPANLQPGLHTTVVDFSYTDVVTVLFAAATLVLTGVAIVIGIFAFLGYRELHSAAQRGIQSSVAGETEKIRAEIVSEIRKQVTEKLPDHLEAASYATTRSGLPDFGEELDVAFDPTDDGER